MMARPGMTMSYKSGSVFGKTPPSTTPVPTKPAAVDDSSDLVGGELKGGEEDEDIFSSSDPILGSSSTDIITVDDEEETPKQKIIPSRSTDIRLQPNWKEENRKKKEEEEKKRKGVLGGQALSKKKEELTKKRILAEHLKKMKLEVEDRERIRCINDQKKRILRVPIGSLFQSLGVLISLGDSDC